MLRIGQDGPSEGNIVDEAISNTLTTTTISGTIVKTMYLAKKWSGGRLGSRV